MATPLNVEINDPNISSICRNLRYCYNHILDYAKRSFETILEVWPAQAKRVSPRQIRALIKLSTAKSQWSKSNVIIAIFLLFFGSTTAYINSWNEG